jgi:hypothetical protein
MSEKDFPQEITKDNIQQLREKAEKIRQKTLQFRYEIVLVVPYVILGFSVVLYSLRFVVWLLQNHYLDFLLLFSSELQPIIFFVLMFAVVSVISLPTLSFILLSIMWLLRKYIGYPKHEEAIFAECFIIAHYLTNNERMKAKKEVGGFLAFLTTFARDWFNPKKKVYGPEFAFLRRGKTEICRMLMFSKEKIPDLLMTFGLAFVRDDDPEAFDKLRQLVEKVREYGEPKGRFQKFLGAIERYPQSLTWILTTIIFIVSLLLTIFGYRPPS